jgi:hypothetical protein
VQFALYRILERFATDPMEDARIVFAQNTITAAKAFMPFGSGLGTFVPVYQMFEPPSDTLPNIYANHAHNDFLELWLETGVLGPLLLCLFLVWLGAASVRLWRRLPPQVSAFDCTLARAATIAIALLLVHAFVDYALRTEAIMAVFAVCCALLVKPLKDGEEGVRFAASLERYLAGRRTVQIPQTKAAASAPIPTASAVPERATDEVLARTHQEGRRWGAHIEWPEEWQNSEQQKRKSDPKTDTNRHSKIETEQ